MARVAILAILFFNAVLLSFASANGNKGHDLHVDFYSNACPQAERIVADVVREGVFRNVSLAAGLIRLHFHDCFVEGCDASILLDSTPSGEPTEKQSIFNGNTLRGLELIDQAKAKLEKACPGTVSCSDILAFAARDTAVLSGLRQYNVPGGRRDGLSSRAALVRANLPTPKSPVKDMVEMFDKKGMSKAELVALLGSHSIGVAHCSSFDYRIYNFSNTSRQDPGLSQSHAFYLKRTCPTKGVWDQRLSSEIAVKVNMISHDRLSNSFYHSILQGRGLLQSDQVLVDDPETRELVQWFATDSEYWEERFIRAMVKMGRLDVLTRRKGEIRKNCRAINTQHPDPINTPGSDVINEPDPVFLIPQFFY